MEKEKAVLESKTYKVDPLLHEDARKIAVLKGTTLSAVLAKKVADYRKKNLHLLPK